MMRACHLNTCPVGIATQDPELRKRFAGQPEHVVNFFFFVAEELRGIMASLGVRTLDEMIGRADLLEADEAVEHWKARGVDLSGVLAIPERRRPGTPRRRVEAPPEVLGDHLDWELLEQARPAIDARRAGALLDQPIRNVDRCVGGVLSSHVAARYGQAGPAGRTPSSVDLHGSAGQSFGGWLAHGVTFSLRRRRQRLRRQGPLGRRARRCVPPEDARVRAPRRTSSSATPCSTARPSGKAFFRGMAGERFAVRNSGADAVVEGVGDHGCEYMTGGRVVVLGATGRNFAAGMSGGLAFVYDPRRHVPQARRQPDDARPARRARRGRGPGRAARAVEEHVRAHRLPGGRAHPRRLATKLLPKFVKIFPTDYKRVLAERAEAARDRPEARPEVEIDG